MNASEESELQSKGLEEFLSSWESHCLLKKGFRRMNVILRFFFLQGKKLK